MITASIVLYNSPVDKLYDVINSFLPEDENIAGRKLYLIDNSPAKMSEDSLMSVTGGRDIEYIFNDGKNLGYGGAHNIALRKSIECGAKYHVVLNPDVRFEPSVITELENYCDENQDVVYILPKVVYPDGELQYLCKLLPTPFNLIFRRFLPKTAFTQKIDDRYTLKISGYDKIMNPPCLSGCFMFMRTGALKEHNIFFDESYFMYCEDFDIIRRLHRIGKTVYYPNTTIIHDHAKASYKSKKMLMIHIKSAIKYFNKFGWFFDSERARMNRQILKEVTE